MVEEELNRGGIPGGGGGGWEGGIHMLGVRGCASRQGVLFEDICSHGVYFLPIFHVCVLSSMLFNLIVSYVFPQGIQSQGFLIIFYVLLGPGPGSQGCTTPSILVPSDMYILINAPPPSIPLLIYIEYLASIEHSSKILSINAARLLQSTEHRSRYSWTFLLIFLTISIYLDSITFPFYIHISRLNNLSFLYPYI